jgi:hypothetical protein
LVSRCDEIDAARTAARTVTVDELLERRLTLASPDEPLGQVVERMLLREADFATLTIAAYAGVLLLSALAYSILVRTIVACQPPDSVLVTAIGADTKGKISLLLYVAAIPLTFLNRWLALGLLAFVALIWLVPDRRIESRLNTSSHTESSAH